MTTRRIGTDGTTARAMVGAGLLVIGVTVHPLDWADAAWGLLGLPLATTLLLRLRGTDARPVRWTSPLGHIANTAIAVGLFTLNHQAAFLFYGAAMLLAAWQGYAGCELFAFANRINGRFDEIGCPVFLPIDAAEHRQSSLRNNHGRGSPMTTITPTVDHLTDMIRSSSSGLATLDDDQQRRALALLRAVARGAPVAVNDLAIEIGTDHSQLDAFVDSLPGVFRDEERRVVGFWGLTVVDFGPHRYRLGDRDLWAWCAWDPLILTPWLGGSARVDSVDPFTQERVSLEIVEGEIADTSHPGLTLSFKGVTEWTSDVVTSFCHYIHFFADVDSARAWTQERPGTFPISLDEGRRLAGAWGQAVFPSLDPATA